MYKLFNLSTRGIAVAAALLPGFAFPISAFSQSTPGGCVPAPLNLVSWWLAESNANDFAGGNNGQLVNGVNFAPGEVRQAFSFNGTNSYVEVPDAPSLRLTNQLTLEFWAHKTILDHVDYVVEKGGDWTAGQQNYGVALHDNANGNCFGFYFANGWRGAGAVRDTQWHHFALVAQQGQADPIFYIDGVPQTIIYRGGSPTLNLYPSTGPLHLGAQVDPVSGWNYYSQAVLDEVSIYNRALSAAEIQAIYSAGSAGKCLASLPLKAAQFNTGNLAIHFSGVPGRTYTIQRASSPGGPWSTVGQAYVGPDGHGHFSDPSPLPGAAFYRTLYP